MHCHIGWHAAEGFSLQFIVREDEIPDLISPQEAQDADRGCMEWDAFVERTRLIQDDSGI